MGNIYSAYLMLHPPRDISSTMNPLFMRDGSRTRYGLSETRQYEYTVYHDGAYYGFIALASFLLVIYSLLAGLILAVCGLDMTLLHLKSITGPVKQRYSLHLFCLCLDVNNLQETSPCRGSNEVPWKLDALYVPLYYSLFRQLLIVFRFLDHLHSSLRRIASNGYPKRLAWRPAMGANPHIHLDNCNFCGDSAPVYHSQTRYKMGVFLLSSDLGLHVAHLHRQLSACLVA